MYDKAELDLIRRAITSFDWVNSLVNLGTFIVVSNNFLTPLSLTSLVFNFLSAIIIILQINKYSQFIYTRKPKYSSFSYTQ